MRFHRISPCPRCGGKVKAKWERDGVQWLPEYTFFIVMFRCTVLFFDETRRACAECVRRRNGYQSRRAKARRDAARVLLNKWLDKQMEVDDELA